MMNLRTATLLIVDDQEPNVHLLKRILQVEGFTQVVSTTDPREALALYQQHQPDLVLLDLNMPYLDGFAVLNQLKSAPATLAPNVLILTAQSEASIRIRALQSGARDFLSKPFDRQEVTSRIRNLLENHLLQKELHNHNKNLEALVEQRTAQVKETQIEALNTLGKAAEFRDNETGMHVVRVGQITRLLAKAAGLDEDMQEMLFLAAPMHDIGKIGIPDAILLKPGKLDPDEWAIMLTHAAKGAEILHGQTAPVMALASEIAISHHEKWDGSGYPNGLAGEAIPLSGRLVAIADVFDALTSVRPYKKAWPLEEVYAFFQEQSGKHFDPNLIALLERNWAAMIDIKTRFADTCTDHATA